MSRRGAAGAAAGTSASAGADGASWEPAWCSKNKRWYYQDRITGRSVWDRPKGCTLRLPSKPPSEVDRGSLVSDATSLPPGWEASYDPTYKRTYYFNRGTQERSWQRPLLPAAPAARAAALPGRLGDGGVGGGGSLPSTLGGGGATNPLVEADPRAGAGAGGGGPPGRGGGGSADGGHPSPGDRALRDRLTLSPDRYNPVAAAPPPERRSRTKDAADTGETRDICSDANPEPTRGPCGGRNPVAGADGRYGRGAYAASGSAAERWDAEDFLRRLREAQATGNKNAIKKVMVDVSEHNYLIRDKWRPLPRTTAVTYAECARAKVAPMRRDPEVSLSSKTTADALRHFAQRPNTVVCGLNFANGSSVGGGYKNGAIAQEEDLCRRLPQLFTSLFNAKRDGYYPFGPCTYRSPSDPARYSDVLFTQGLVLGRAGQDRGFALLPPEEQVKVSIVTAAAPNVNFAKEVYDVDLMYNTTQSIFITPRLMQPDVNVLVLGAWGCGVFGGDPRDISDLFARALADRGLGGLYGEVHFALPRFDADDVNSRAFRETLTRHGIRFKET